MKLKTYCLLAACLSLASPAQAITQPTDSVGVINYDNNFARYFKPWKDLKLDASTRTALNTRNQAIDKEDGFEKYRIGFLFIANGKVDRVAFYGDYGSVKMMDWPSGKDCSLNFHGNGGYAGIHQKACAE